MGSGFITQRGFTTFTRNSPGDYSLVLAGTPPPDNNCVVNVTLRTLFSVPVVFRAIVAAGVVRVQFFNTATGQQGFADADFNVIVTDDR